MEGVQWLGFFFWCLVTVSGWEGFSWCLELWVTISGWEVFVSGWEVYFFVLELVLLSVSVF